MSDESYIFFEKRARYKISVGLIATVTVEIMENWYTIRIFVYRRMTAHSSVGRAADS